MNNQLLLAWKSHKSNAWIPVGKLSFVNEKFIFQYTSAAELSAKNDDFVPFSTMQDMTKCYESSKLFPLFQNRLLPKSRPEYISYLDWLNLKIDNFSPLDELAMSGGIRVTDNLQLFPIPLKNNGKYEVHFFSHGIRHLPSYYIERISHLSHGNKLYLMADIQNKYDPFALAIRTEDPPEIVGYAPRFFARDFNKLLTANSPNNIHVIVEKINLEAPLQFKLLCKFTTNWPENFKPFCDDDFNCFS